MRSNRRKESKMAKYKQHTRTGEGSSVKSVHLYIDIDLLPVLQEQPNKTRFVNDAIRAYIKKKREKVMAEQSF